MNTSTCGLHVGLLLLTMMCRCLCETDHAFQEKERNSDSESMRRNRDRRAIGDCGVTYHGTGGVFSSPSYPDDYYDLATCNYYIEAPLGHRIILTFLMFDIEDGHDYLTLYDGPDIYNYSSYEEFTGSSLPPDFISTSRSLYLIFTSDGSDTNKGFYATYTAFSGDLTDITSGPDVLACASYSYVQSVGGEMTSHGTFPDSYHSAMGVPYECSLIFLTINPFTHISIKLTDIDIYNNNQYGGCEAGDILVISGNSYEYTYCGDDISRTESNAEIMSEARLQFNITVQPMSQHRGFKGTYVQFYYASGSECNSPGEYRCELGHCISDVLECDGHEHCPDGSDERHCDGEKEEGFNGGMIGGIVSVVVCVVLYSVIRHQKSKQRSAVGSRQPPQRAPPTEPPKREERPNSAPLSMGFPKCSRVSPRRVESNETTPSTSLPVLQPPPRPTSDNNTTLPSDRPTLPPITTPPGETCPYQFDRREDNYLAFPPPPAVIDATDLPPPPSYQAAIATRYP